MPQSEHIVAVAFDYGWVRDHVPDRENIKMVWLFVKDANYSLDRVRRNFVATNPDIFGDHDRWRVRELLKWKSLNRFMKWTENQKAGTLYGWTSPPMRLLP